MKTTAVVFIGLLGVPAGADYLHIKGHGSLWDYIAAHAHAVLPVATALASAVKTNSLTFRQESVVGSIVSFTSYFD